MTSTDRLTLATPSFVDRGCLVFLRADGQLRLDEHQTSLVFPVLPLFDGSRARQTCEIEADSITARGAAVVRDLLRLRIVVSVNSQYQRQVELERNPQWLAEARAPQQVREHRQGRRTQERSRSIAPQWSDTHRAALLKLVDQRRSCRAFASDAELTSDALESVLSLAYGDLTRPVPSAGALYPLQLHVLERDAHEVLLSAWNRSSERLERISKIAAVQELAFALDQEQCLYDASAVVVISGDIAVSAYKYGCRGYRFALLEAGHVAQMLNLASAAHGLSTLVYGGFKDEPLAALLGTGAVPLVVVAVGRPSAASGPTIEDQYMQLVEALVPAVCPEGPRFRTANEVQLAGVPLTLAVAPYAVPAGDAVKPMDADDRYGAGAAASRSAAGLKALAESYERFASGHVRADFMAASESEVQASGVTTLDPRALYPLDEAALAAVDFLAPYSPDQRYDWVIGEDEAGQLFAAPIDCVFYPLSARAIGRPLVALATSSGVAAHSTVRAARHAAVMELVERDAFMRAWMAAEPPPRLAIDDLPRGLRGMLLNIEAQGYAVHVCMLPAEAPTVLVVFRGRAHPALVCGAGSSVLSLDDAAGRAVNEALASLVSARRDQDVARPRKDDLRVPRDRVLYYFDQANAAAVDGFFSGPRRPLTWEAAPPDLSRIVERCRPVYFDLTLPDQQFVCTRAVSSELVPIWFGPGVGYAEHRSLTGLDVPGSWRKAGQPHFFP